MGHAAWESDSARYSDLVSYEWRALPVTSIQLRRKRAELATLMARLLGQRRFDLD